jgi:HlyD family secretion protein
MKKKLPLLVLLAAGIAGALVYQRHQAAARSNSTAIRVSGNIEVTDAEVSFKIAGRVVERLVTEGEKVKAGQLVARLEDAELAQDVALRQAELRAAQAALAELEAGSRPEEIAQADAAALKAQKALDELLAGSRPEDVAAAEAAARKAEAALNDLLAGSRPQEIAVADATLERTKVEEARLKVDFGRQEALYKKGAVSAQDYDTAKSSFEVGVARRREAEEQLKLVQEGPRKFQIQQARDALAESKAKLDLVRKGPRTETIEQARAAVAEANARAELVRKGPRRETIDQAKARVDQTRATLAEAQTRLSYAKIESPLTGVVLSKNIEPGEYVAPGTPVVTVGDLVNVWLRAYINESDLGRVNLGQRARVTTDTYPGRIYEGRVSFISSQAEFTPKNVQTERERVKLVYRVKIDIPNPKTELLPGMPADATILVGRADEDDAKFQMPDAKSGN